MTHAVFIQNPDSIYDDRPGEAYHFPRRYLKRVEQTLGAWVIFYEGKRGAKGYVGVGKVADILPDRGRAKHYYARLVPGSYLDFSRVVPRTDPLSDTRYERGLPATGGSNSAAVRLISAEEFASIVREGLRLPEMVGNVPLARQPELPPGMAEAPVAFEHAAGELPGVRELIARPDILAGRKWRDPAFRSRVVTAYGFRCAISGLELRNGGGRPEVEAAHIRPVAAGGPDMVQNGLALSGTLHWMFDRGLIGVAEDHAILISHNKVPADVANRLIAPERRLRLPDDPRLHPHPAFLRYHRERVFGQVA